MIHKTLIHFLLLIIFSSSLIASDYNSELNCKTDDNCDVKIVDGKKLGKEICRALDNPKIVLLEANYKEGIPDGAFICRSFLGFVLATGEYSDGKKNGEFRLFDESQNIWNIEYFEKDKNIKLAFKADENFHVKDYIGACIKNNQNITYNECLSEKFGIFDSQVRAHLKEMAAAEFKDKNKDISVNYANGKPRIRGKWVNGTFDGPYNTFFETGLPQMSRNYQHGFLVEEKEYFKEGQLSHQYNFSKDGGEKGIDFFQNSQKQKEFEIVGVFPNQIETGTHFFDNGHKRHEYKAHINSNFGYGYYHYFGEQKTYSEDGVQTSSEIYNDKGLLDGKSFYIYFHKKQSYRFESLWKDGILVEETKYNEKTNEPLEKSEYFPDGSIKQKTKY